MPPLGRIRLPLRPLTPSLSTRRSLATAPPTPAARRSLLDLGLIAAGGVAVTGLLFASSRRNKSDMAGDDGDRPSFTVPVLSQ